MAPTSYRDTADVGFGDPALPTPMARRLQDTEDEGSAVICNKEMYVFCYVLGTTSRPIICTRRCLAPLYAHDATKVSN
jgi:hypothetical protein